RNQLCALPASLCGLPLRVLNASNNKLVCIPEAIGQLRSLMELDVSCNEITALPRHIGRLKALRELNVRRNLLCVLPEDLAELPLVKFDFSCNKVSTIPVCYRKMSQLQSLQLENNPLQSPPAQICIKGKVHVFKYLSIEACRSDKMPDSLYLPPSDEDSLSLNVPMSHITEEEGLSKDDSSEHISALTADPHRDGVQLIEESPTEALKEQFGYRDSSALSNCFVTEGTHIAMINQLKEAVELLQDPNRVNMETEDLSGIQLYPVEMVMVEDSINGQDSDGGDGQTTPKWDIPDGGFEFQKKRELILERARLEAQLACQQYERHMSNQGEDRVPGSSPTFTIPAFGLKPRSAPASLPCSPPPCLRPLLTQALSVDRDTPPRPVDGGMHS
ncbi:unnamed protein product, partial [Coregonus sp. 'balchen']